MDSKVIGPIQRLNKEMRHLEDLVREMHPSSGEVPRLTRMDVAGLELPLIGGCGGDHIVYVDFNTMFDLEARIQRARLDRPEIIDRLEESHYRAGVLIADASGHQRTDALLVAMLHQAFVSCLPYELDAHGCITSELFENLNDGFYRTVGRSKYITMIYGEISEDGQFHFLSAGHPPPMVFSNHYDRLMEMNDANWTSSTPLGMLPSRVRIDASRLHSPLPPRNAFIMNRLTLMGAGDILLLYSDGLLEHADGEFFTRGLEPALRDAKHESAVQICAALATCVHAFAPQRDDISYVVIKKRW